MHLDDAYKCMVIVGVVRSVIGMVPCICNDGPYCGLHGYMHLVGVQKCMVMCSETSRKSFPVFPNVLSSIPESPFLS